MTNPTDPTELRIREIVETIQRKEWLTTNDPNETNEKVDARTDYATSEIMKIVKEKDDLIATLKDCLHKGMTQEALFFMFDRDKLRKENQEKDERIKELESYVGKAPSVWRKEFEALEEKLLSRQKAVDGLVENLLKGGCGGHNPDHHDFVDVGNHGVIDIFCLNCREEFLSHYQSLRETKGPDAEHRPLNGGSLNEKV